MNNKLSLNCSGTERQEGGQWGSAERGGGVFNCQWESVDNSRAEWMVWWGEGEGGVQV